MCKYVFDSVQTEYKVTDCTVNLLAALLSCGILFAGGNLVSPKQVTHVKFGCFPWKCQPLLSVFMKNGYIYYQNIVTKVLGKLNISPRNL
ncbi:hypothetical protein DP117_22045 [Brasilonema sp. UFV-L1]|nr:hypothetical protein [Brasilonema sp. UFV-L1]